MKSYSTLQRLAAGLLLTAALVMAAFPFIWMFLASFKSNPEIFQPLKFLPESFSLRYYKELFTGDWLTPGFARLYLNTFLYAACQALGAVLTSLTAAYAFTQLRFRGKTVLFLLALGLVVIPPQLTMVPLARWMTVIGLFDTPFAVILPGMLSGIGLIFFTISMRRIPSEYLDVARAEGASEFRTFLIILPLLTPAILTFSVLHFMLAWNDHILPSILLHSPEHTTVTVAMSRLLEPSSHVPYAILMASSVFLLLPTALFLALAFRHLRSALSDLIVH